MTPNALTRDWTKTLWPASYKGFPFYFDSDDEAGGLGIITHLFPNSDIPFNEDLGENARYFNGSAYVFGDTADVQSAAFIAVLVSHGPGILTVPVDGPVLVRALTFKRRSELDKLGYIAFDVKFVREGAPFALISVPLAGQIALTAAAGVAAAIVTTFPAMGG